MIYTKNIWSLLNRNRDRKFYFVRHIETLAGQSLPCVKGGGTCQRDGGIVMQRKHNKDIVPTAKINNKHL